jgi:hypothetical protein
MSLKTFVLRIFSLRISRNRIFSWKCSLLKYCNRQGDKEVHRPWGKWGHLWCWERWGTRPARQRGERTVGFGQWRKLDVSRCWKARETGSARHQATLMHRVCIICVSCAIIYHIFNDCNLELCLTVFICSRRINHLAIKNHLYSSSGVREVVSSKKKYCHKKARKIWLSFPNKFF